MNYHSAGSRLENISHGAMTAAAARQAQDLARIIGARRRRQQFFSTHLFSDPAWDILLTLALSELEQQRVTVSELCGGADAPYTTALRYIQAMIDEGLVVRRDDPLDGRRKFLSLSPGASKQVSAYLNTPSFCAIKAA